MTDVSGINQTFYSSTLDARIVLKRRVLNEDEVSIPNR